MAALVLTFSLVLARVGAFVAALPLFGGLNVPRPVKAGLAMALSVLWFGTACTTVTPELLDRPAETSWLAFGVALGRETLLGALLGYAFGLFLVPARVAGEFITEQLGLTFGAFVDPTGQSNVSGLTQILDIFAAVLFLGLDGHHVFLAVLDATFARYPLGGAMPPAPVREMTAALTATQAWGLSLAAPMAVLTFVVTLVLTLMTRAAPQINLFSVGFPLRLAAGLVVVFLLLPNFLRHLTNVLGWCGDLVARLI